MLKQKDNQKDLTPWPEEENLFLRGHTSFLLLGALTRSRGINQEDEVTDRFPGRHLP